MQIPISLMKNFNAKIYNGSLRHSTLGMNVIVANGRGLLRLSTVFNRVGSLLHFTWFRYTLHRGFTTFFSNGVSRFPASAWFLLKGPFKTFSNNLPFNIRYIASVNSDNLYIQGFYKLLNSILNGNPFRPGVTQLECEKAILDYIEK